jgi:hypothetical protein
MLEADVKFLAKHLHTGHQFSTPLLRSTVDQGQIRNLNEPAPRMSITLEAEYTQTKTEELEKEISLRRELMLEDYVAFFLEQKGNYPKSAFIMNSFLRVATILIENRDPGMVEHKHILLKSSRQIPHPGYQKLVGELMEAGNL